MKIKEYVDKIVDSENTGYMEELSDMLVELINNSDKKKDYKCKLKGMANNYKIDREMAEEIVECMNPLGEYWDYDTIKSLGSDLNTDELYLVMNSLANDYSEVIPLSETDKYLKMAKAFINDEDANKNKVWIYFTEIPNKD